MKLLSFLATHRRGLMFCLSIHLVLWAFQVVNSQSSPVKNDGFRAQEDRRNSVAVLYSMRNTLREYYFDKSMRGLDIDAKLKAAEARINSLNSNWEMYRVLAQFLLDLNDSHTYFALPPRADRFSYGFDVQIIGTECVVTSVRTGSDAEKKGLQVGDRIDKIGKHVPTRQDLWKILYVLYQLNPGKEIGVQISKPDGTSKILLIVGSARSRKEFAEEIKKRKAAGEYKPYTCRPVNQEIIACKLRTFSVDPQSIEKLMKAAAPYKKLILDLRGNPGGYVSTEQFLIGAFFANEVKIGDEINRKKVEARNAKGWGNNAYKGELAVLLDSDSASASEVFARVIQIEKRGLVFGDLSSGSVMTSIFVPISSNTDPWTTVIGGQFGMSVTVGDLIMKDGGRLENIGVTPDFPIIPTQQAIALRLDPVLALCATKFGFPLSPEAAGSFHFITERSESSVKSDETSQ